MQLTVYKALGLAAVALAIGACSKGGNLTLEPGAIVVKTKGSPYVQVVDGAKANLTGAAGVTGWVTIQPVSSVNVSSGTHNITLNKPSTYP